MRDDSWRDRAACRGVDVELFYSETESDIRVALAICARCEVRAQCLEQAMTQRELFGVWGGTLERQ
ncbi:MAG: WhiB family transcriptional regulator, partial [Actinomycetota bacterium]|nr:WhiB family transcriptional regulator [Actinomycetota bacterium]